MLALLIGEGGSGGALALAVADQVWMMENAVYSVISPEGCASILWKDSSKVADAAECLKLTSHDLYKMNVIEKIIREPKTADSGRLYESLGKSYLRDLPGGEKASGGATAGAALSKISKIWGGKLIPPFLLGYSSKILPNNVK